MTASKGDRVTHFADPDYWGTVTEAELGTILVEWDTGHVQRLTPDAVRVRRPATPPPPRKSYEEELIEAGECPELVWYDTEDGRVDGRCMAPIVPGGYACPGHTAQIEEWRGQSEEETAAWERKLDEAAAW